MTPSARLKNSSISRLQPMWPSRLIELGRALQGNRLDQEREPLRAETWLLLNTALQKQIRFESLRTGPIGREDTEDLASEKALELMRKIDEGGWDLAGSERQVVVAFVRTVARNGLVDLLRRRSRSPIRSAQVNSHELATVVKPNERGERPDAAAERVGFVAALIECADGLTATHRKAWILRVLLELPSKAVAAHPEIALKPSHVDVILQRCRSSIRDCMRTKGYGSRDMPPGTFVGLWRAFVMKGHLHENALDVNE